MTDVEKKVSFKWALVLTALTILAGIYGILTVDLNTAVPTSWDFDGTITNYDSPLLALTVLPIIQVIILLIACKINVFDPRAENLKASPKAVSAILTAIFALFFSLQIFMLLSAKGMPASINAIQILIGFLFIVIGNYFGKLKSSFILGIRTPWTLSSDTVWRKTHRLGGKTFVAGGFALLLTALVFGNGVIYKWLFFSIIAVTVAVPVLYSWYIWQQENKDIQQK
ncbi:SdpI family protein [Kordiimonas pumila]|uniref:SdpI family protein n=1 Tax=Kordiimonas pumila TaxID=2161677 RepID=A0ABV7D9A2_9PROT|nr:SdpI family protein [Kordiimonas pumila]